jgi:hypothetical protein
LSPPAAVAPIATASEEHKEDNDNKNKFHIFLQNMWGEVLVDT